MDERKISTNYISHNQCESEMSTMPDDCIDLVVTDPPYGAKFMDKDWDRAMPTVDMWKRLLRVLKPGAFAFVMSLPRQDLLARMIVNLEDAGFQVNYSPILWAFGTGFPKAQNVGKMVDKRLGAEREVVEERYKGKHAGGNSYQWSEMDNETGNANITAPATPEAQALDGSYSGYQAKPAYEFIITCRKPFADKHRRSDVYKMLAYKYGYWYTQHTVVKEPEGNSKGNIDQLTKKWGKELQKIGYTLKDGDVIERRLALNPIYIDSVLINRDVDLCLWWKPYSNTDITSSITHALATGKGITWLDAGRIPYESDNDVWQDHTATGLAKDKFFTRGEQSVIDKQPHTQGRFAPNLLVSGDALNDGRVSAGTERTGFPGGSTFGGAPMKAQLGHWYGDSGSFSRYFSLDAWSEANLPDSVKHTFPFLIVPKPSPSEKNAGLDGLDEKNKPSGGHGNKEDDPISRALGSQRTAKNHHPTVKPIKLMSYLIAIGSRPGDVVLDPYAGSGTTGVAAALLDRRYVLIEQDAEYCDIAERRIAWHVEQAKEEKAQPDLFREDGD